MFAFKKKKKDPQPSSTDAAISSDPVQAVAENPTVIQSTDAAHNPSNAGQHSPMFLKNEMYRMTTAVIDPQAQLGTVYQGPPQPGAVYQVPPQPGAVYQVPPQPGAVYQVQAPPGAMYHQIQPGTVYQGPPHPSTGTVYQTSPQPVYQGPPHLNTSTVYQTPLQPGTVYQTSPQPSTAYPTPPQPTTVYQTSPQLGTVYQTSPQLGTVYQTSPQLGTVYQTSPQLGTVYQTSPQLATSNTASAQPSAVYQAQPPNAISGPVTAVAANRQGMQPGNPQLVHDTPLVVTIPTQDSNNAGRPAEPRAPHTLVAGSDWSPSSYGPISNPEHTTTPVLDLTIKTPVSTNASALDIHTNPHLQGGPSLTPLHPPTAPPPPPASSLTSQPLPYPIPTGTNSWTQQPLPTSTGYTPRPYVVPGSEVQSYPLIMAIDWGTTYSSMAYASKQDGEVHEVSTWPKQSHNYPKVPTCNLYGPSSKEIQEWGYPAKIAMTKPPYKHHILLSKYKLHLDESSGPSPPLPNGLTIGEAISDYLKLFHAHVVQTVLRAFGAAYDQRHIQYCLTVPAMWTDHAKSIMRQAALQAGMISPTDPPHRLLLISEPEAAAIYCEKKCDQYAINPGQRFMICDAGGGTVDLIVFEVVAEAHGRTLKEVTRGSGHSCGSIFLDERMEALLRRKFSKWTDRTLTPANWVQLMDTFIHNVKPLFDGIDDQYISMPAVPGRAELTDYEIGLEDGVLTVTAEEMRREVFDPVVDDVLRLIQHQLQLTNFNCQGIFLVGGFGCSSYLLTRVQSEFSHIVRAIAVPPRAELAVVRGAALAGIAPHTVAARVARRWYGVDSLMAFEVGYDEPHRQILDHEGQLRARDRFSVYVAPGQQIGVDECITKRYVTFQYPKPVSSPLYACTSMTQPRYIDSPMVEKIGDFTIPLPFIPGAQQGHKIMFDLRMYFGATEIRAEAEVNGMVVTTRCQFSG